MTGNIGSPRECMGCGKIKYYTDKQWERIKKPYNCNPCKAKARSRNKYGFSPKIETK